MIEQKFQLLNGESPGENILVTVPFISETMGGLVVKEASQGGIFAWLEPFNWQLWLATILFIFISAGAINLLNVLNTNPQTGSESPDQSEDASFPLRLMRSFSVEYYHSWAMLLGGESSEWTSWPSKVFRLGMLLFTTILMATYTGNLFCSH